MTPNEIEAAKEDINFLSRILIAYIAGIYLLGGALGAHTMEWLASDELVWSEFGIVPAVGLVVLFGLTAEAARLLRKIRRIINQIRRAPS